MTSETTGAQAVQHRFSLTVVGDAALDGGAVVIGALVLSLLVRASALLSWGEYKLAFEGLVHLFDDHAKHARLSFATLALGLGAIPMCFAADPLLESLTSVLVSKVLRFLSHLLLAAIGLGSPVILMMSSALGGSILLIALWFALAVSLLWLASSYSEKMTYRNHFELAVGKLIGVTVPILSFLCIPATHSVTLV